MDLVCKKPVVNSICISYKMTMEHDFWHQRWQQEKTGFHLPETNPLLIEHQEKLDLSPGDEVFVPLCGKSQDMFWFQKQGCQVIGVELSEIALNAFFESNNIPVKKLKSGEFNLFQSQGLMLYGGDFFKLSLAVTQSCKLIYDRAALIALPDEMRTLYAQHLLKITPADAQILLITLEYPQDEMAGPPFSVTKSEVEVVFSTHFEINILSDRDVLAAHEKFFDQGLTSLRETAYLLKPL